MTCRRSIRPVAGLPAARRQTLRFAAGLALVAALRPLLAQPAAAPAGRLRLRLERDVRRLEVGEAIIVSLEVWVSSWFQAGVEFPPTLDTQGALVEVIGGSPESRFEEFAGRRWTGLIRRYRVLPVQPGEIAIALPGPLQIQPGGGRLLRLAPPAPLRLTVKVPAGAEDIQPFVAARHLTLQQRWWPAAGPGAAPLQAGDLVRRKIVIVTDSSSPLMPAPDFGAPAGVAVRVQAPEVREQRVNAAATPTQTRRHEAVYTLQQAGPVELPAVELVWWDLRARRRRVGRLDGMLLDVQPAAQRPDPFALPQPQAINETSQAIMGGPAMKLVLGASLLAAAAAGLVLRRRYRRRVSAGSASAKAQGSTLAAERLAWRQLRRACRRGDAASADVALSAVLVALDPDTRQRWLQEGEFAARLSELARLRFGPSVPAGAAAIRWQGLPLWRAVTRLRQAAEGAGAASGLPALHP